MVRLVYAFIVGLFGAGIVHIAILLLVPEFSERDAWSRLAMVSDLYRPTRLDAELEGQPIIRTGDPLVLATACRFDLGDGVLHATAPGAVPFWSASVYNRGGQNVYSFNDRTAAEGRLDFVVLTPDQMIEVRKDLPETFARSVFVETPLGEGILVVRAFVPDASWKPAVDRFLSAFGCALR